MTFVAIFSTVFVFASMVCIALALRVPRSAFRAPRCPAPLRLCVRLNPQLLRRLA